MKLIGTFSMETEIESQEMAMLHLCEISCKGGNNSSVTRLHSPARFFWFCYTFCLIILPVFFIYEEYIICFTRFHNLRNAMSSFHWRNLVIFVVVFFFSSDIPGMQSFKSIKTGIINSYNVQNKMQWMMGNKVRYRNRIWKIDTYFKDKTINK